ncbi:MAG: glycosyl hydrolase family 28-related protein [Planctomycetota bacterium]
MSFADFAADNEGKALQTDNLAKAIAQTPTGGVLYFPPGVYRTGTFRLKSDMTLYLAGGAVIKASDDPADFPPDETSSHIYRHGFLLAGGARNLKIAG